MRPLSSKILNPVTGLIKLLEAGTGRLMKPFRKTFDAVKAYFERISDNFILIPNKEYFVKAPFDKKAGRRVEIFDVNEFTDKLVSIIESPTRRERKLMDKFYTIFNKSYSDVGELESITKMRDKIFVIFGTSVTSLPLEDQGLGAQDLFLYLAHIILFEEAIIDIEEPEGGLSTENQRVLNSIISDIYSHSGKQIFISSHSEEFELSESYLIEIGRDGTREIGRSEQDEEYEEKIDKVLLKRNLVQEKERYKTLLIEMSERQMTLDVLSYVNNLGEEATIDAKRISDKLGYPQKKVQAILREASRKK